MSFLKSLLFGKDQSSNLKIKYSDNYKAWYVKRDYSILYIGKKEKCELYVKNMELAN